MKRSRGPLRDLARGSSTAAARCVLARVILGFLAFGVTGCGTTWLPEPPLRRVAMVEQPPVPAPGRRPSLGALHWDQTHWPSDPDLDAQLPEPQAVARHGSNDEPGVAAEAAPRARAETLASPAFAGPRPTLRVSAGQLLLQREVAHAEDHFRSTRFAQDQLHSELQAWLPALVTRQELLREERLFEAPPGGAGAAERQGADGRGVLSARCQAWRVVALLEGPEGGYRLLRAPVSDGDLARAESLLVVGHGVMLDGMIPAGNGVALWEREAGTPHLRVVEVGTRAAHRVELPEAVHALTPVAHHPSPYGSLRFLYESPTTPPVLCEVFAAQQRLSMEPAVAFSPPAVLPGLLARRVHARAPDGARIPVTLLLPPGPPRALVIRTEPSHGIHSALGYSPIDLVLMARGIALVIVHGRQGVEAWTGQVHLPAASPGVRARDAEDLLAAMDLLAGQRVAPPGPVLAWGRARGAESLAEAVLRAPQRFAALVLEQPSAALLESLRADARDLELPPLLVSAATSHLEATHGAPLELLARWRMNVRGPPSLARVFITVPAPCERSGSAVSLAQAHHPDVPPPTWDTCRLVQFLLAHAGG